MRINKSNIGGHGRKFIPVCDSRNRRVPGLQMRAGGFYGSVWDAGADGKKTARKFRQLTPEGVPCGNLAEAKAARDLLQGAKQSEALPVAGRKPGFSTWADHFLLPWRKKPVRSRMRRNHSPGGNPILAQLSWIGSQRP